MHTCLTVQVYIKIFFANVSFLTLTLLLAMILTGNPKFDPGMRENLLISKYKLILNNNISFMPLYLF